MATINNEEQLNIFNKALRELKEHVKPSEKTIKMYGELKDELSEVTSCVKVMSGNIDTIKEGQYDIRDGQKIQNGRVKKLELWKAALLGGFAVVSIGFPTLFVYFMNDLKHNLSDQISMAIIENNESLNNNLEKVILDSIKNDKFLEARVIDIIENNDWEFKE